jgi:hypothetical protein
MIFLIEYDRPQGRIVTFTVFEDSDRGRADDARFEIELALNRSGIDREVVLLQAATEQAVRRTHRRYFESMTELLSEPVV